MKNLVKFILSLGHDSAKKLYIATFWTVTLSLFESASVGLVYPALVKGLNVSSTGFSDLPQLQRLTEGSIHDESKILLLLLLLLILGSAARVMIFRITTKAGAEIASSKSSELFELFLQGSLVNLSETYARSMKVTLTEHVRLFAIAIIQFLQLVSSVFILISFLLFFLYFEINIGLYIFFAITSVYLSMLWMTRGRIAKNSTRVHDLAHLNNQMVTSGFSLFREIKINSLELAWSSKQSTAIKGERIFDAENQFLGQFPRPIIEAFIWIALVLGVMIFSGTSFNKDLQQVTAQFLFTFVIAQKIVPVMQNIYFSLSSIRGSSLSIAQFQALLLKTKSNAGKLKNYRDDTRIESIQLLNINHRYRNHSSDIFKADINLLVDCGQVVAFSGRSGSGKSTLMDIISGLVIPERGRVLINGSDLNAKGSLMNRIGYAGQTSGLIGDSIRQNIGFASFGSHIEDSDIITAAKLACIHNTISSLPDGYSTIIGENERKLSGGELQRVAIARALFKQPDLLILDEATTGLDYETQFLLLRNLRKYKPSMMIVICTHDQHLLDFADNVIFL